MNLSRLAPLALARMVAHFTARLVALTLGHTSNNELVHALENGIRRALLEVLSPLELVVAGRRIREAAGAVVYRCDTCASPMHADGFCHSDYCGDSVHDGAPGPCEACERAPS